MLPAESSALLAMTVKGPTLSISLRNRSHLFPGVVDSRLIVRQALRRIRETFPLDSLYLSTGEND
jgi:hypothetical protein